MAQCEFCDGQGHLYDQASNTWSRCACIREQVRAQQLGIFYTPAPARKTPLADLVGVNALIEGPLQSLRPHVAKVLLTMAEEGKKVVAMDCYRLVEIFLEKDEEFDTTTQTIDCDLLILLVGFGDPRNRYLPELVNQALGRREVLRLPTWVVLGIGMDSVGLKYGAELAEKFGTFKRVKMR